MDPAEREEHQEDQEEEEEEEEDQEARPGRRQRREQGPHELHNLLRILARQRVVLQPDRARAATNADLVTALRESGMLTSDAVARAMLAVPRGSFVPAEYRDEAYIDAPIRVEAEDFNISAPHMHASMLEALRLRPGDRFLDVGCGCGILAACAAMLVGPTGRVCGVDTREYCVELSADNVDRLRATSPDYAAASCDVEFERHNVFLPSRRYRGQFNKVCVGAACPHDRVHLLMQLLPQEPGSLLLAPVDMDLRLYERRRDGSARPTTLSSVRFSDLEVPCDATVALAMLEDGRAERLAVAVSASTWRRDMAPILGVRAAGGGGAAEEAGGAAPAPAGDSSEEGTPGCGYNNKAAGGSSGGERSDGGRARRSASGDGGGGAGGGAARDFWSVFASVVERLGPADYVLQGPGWQVAAHRDVLKARCPHFRARLSSGMRDSDGDDHTVPDGFAQHSVQTLVCYAYTDALPPGLEPPQLAELLHVGSFYGCSRLLELCEQRMMGALLQLDPEHGAAEAPSLLRLGGELGLAQLQRAAAAYIASHYAAASRSEAYAALSRAEVDRVASELAAAVERMDTVLKDLQPPEGAAQQTVAQRQRMLWW